MILSDAMIAMKRVDLIASHGSERFIYDRQIAHRIAEIVLGIGV